MNRPHLPLLAATAVIVVLSPAAHAASRHASKYVHTEIQPPGAKFIGPAQYVGIYPNAINSRGMVAFHAAFYSTCGGGQAFVYFPSTRKYVMLKNPPGGGTHDTAAFGIADDNSVGVATAACSSQLTTASIYRVTAVDSTPQWSKPCRCRGYEPIGNNLDGIGLISHKHNHPLRPAVLTFPNGAPKVAPLKVRIGKPAKAQMIAVGTPSGFVGTQHNPATHRDVPTVWLHGRPYRLPAAHSNLGPPAPQAMVERHTAHGLRVDVAGIFYSGGTANAAAVDYWLGKRTAHGFAFTEKRHFIKSHDLGDAFGMSTDGSMIFGDCCGDINEADLIIYFTRPHSENHNFAGCPDSGQAWGDSHGDILVENEPLCLAQPRH